MCLNQVDGYGAIAEAPSVAARYGIVHVGGDVASGREFWRNIAEAAEGWVAEGGVSEY